MRQKHSSVRMMGMLLFVLTLSLSLTAASSQTVINAALTRPSLSRHEKRAPGGWNRHRVFDPNSLSSEPVGITNGPDGNLWFTESFGNGIGKITTGGQITEYSLPNAESEPENITSGPVPDGTQCLWFTEFSSVDGNRIGKITISGQITEYALPNADSEPEGITTGPDGNLWFTEFDGNRIGTITSTGQITEYPLPIANSEPAGITSGPCDDGTQNQCLWFTEITVLNGENIGRITTSGTITQYASCPLPMRGPMALRLVPTACCISPRSQ